MSDPLSNTEILTAVDEVTKALSLFENLADELKDTADIDHAFDLSERIFEVLDSISDGGVSNATVLVALIVSLTTILRVNHREDPAGPVLAFATLCALLHHAGVILFGQGIEDLTPKN